MASTASKQAAETSSESTHMFSESQKAKYQEGYLNDRYLEYLLIYQQTLSTDRFPKYYGVEFYAILITNPTKVQ